MTAHVIDGKALAAKLRAEYRVRVQRLRDITGVVPGLIVPQMVKTGAVVIDVGINRMPAGSIIGDVDFEGVKRKASCITSVPGGRRPHDRHHAFA